MGHMAALRRFGFAATAPMFVPGLGAMIRLRQQPVSGREDARIGLAGPMWGLGAAVVAAGVWFVTHDPFWAAVAQVGAWINLFNLLPMKPLDGGRGFSALSRWQAWLVAAAIAGVWIWTGEGLLALLLVAAVLNALAKRPDAPADQTATIQYLFLLVTLSMMCRYVGGHPVGTLAATQPAP
jgi:Zn-dependent protease